MANGNEPITITREEYEKLVINSFRFEQLRNAVLRDDQSIPFSLIRIYLGLYDTSMPVNEENISLKNADLKTENDRNYVPVSVGNYEDFVRDRHTVELLRETVMRGRTVTLPILKIFLGIQDEPENEYPEEQF